VKRSVLLLFPFLAIVAAGGDGFVQNHLNLLKQYAGCTSAAADKLWCKLTGFTAAEKSAAPNPGVYLGVTTFVQTNGGSAATLEKFSRVSSLAVRKSGNDVVGLIATVNPQNDTGKTEVARLLPLVRQQIAGGSKPEIKEPGLSGYISSLPERAKYPLTQHKNGFTLNGGSKADLRRIGGVWVSIEVPQKNPAGIWITVFAAR
jgi:hypothetical protein